MPGPEERLIEQPRPREPDTFREPRRMDDGLRDRLERLPRGHPSSPFRDDGTRKPPPPDYRQAELPLPDEPLTDDQYAKHVQEIRQRLKLAHEQGLDTHKQYTVDPEGQIWSKERRLAQEAIIEDLYSLSAAVPDEGQAIIAGGLPGAGKSTVLQSYAGIERSRYFTIDPDQIKEEMARRGLIPHVEGLSPLETADLVHVESSDIAKRLAHRVQANRKNLIWDITMSSAKTAGNRIEDLRKAGYQNITGIFVEIPVNTSLQRATDRHRAGQEEYRSGKGYGGRYVPPEVTSRQMDEQWESVNRRNFEALKGRFDRWIIFDNSIEGRRPKLLQSSDVERRISDR